MKTNRSKPGVPSLYAKMKEELAKPSFLEELEKKIPLIGGGQGGEGADRKEGLNNLIEEMKESKGKITKKRKMAP